jgi:hypothetical protein
VTTTTELPPALRPWAESLAFLQVEAALHVGPLVRRLDALVRRHDAASAREGEPDGYGGLTTRGHPERLLLSEWLLAEELPLEFLRRAAERELLHIRQVFRAAQPEGRVAAFFDVGPDQLGAARLVQLAALIVLHRRALVRGNELVIGLSDQPSDRWDAGELPELFTTWRKARTASSPGAAELEARERTLDVADELWVLAGAGLARQCPQRRQLLETREAAWDETGPTAVDVRFEGRTTRLTLPAGPIAVRTLRGAVLRRRHRPTATTVTGALSAPAFASFDRRLLLRGARLEEVVATTVPAHLRPGEARPRTHCFSAPVIAAASLGGKRLVALVLDETSLRCEVVGKRLAKVTGLEVPLTELAADAATLLGDDLSPLYYDRGALLCRLGGDWWRLFRDEPPQLERGVVACGPGSVLDLPRRIRHDGDQLVDAANGRVLVREVGSDTRVLVSGERFAWSRDGRDWEIALPGREARITVSAGDEVLGLIDGDAGPALVTRSDAGVLVRLHSVSGVSTLTAASGPAFGHAVHPQHAWLAVQSDESTVDVLNLLTGERLIRVRAR